MSDIIKYGKLQNGELKIHGVDFPIHNEDNTVTITGDVELLTLHGFKEVVYVEPEQIDNYIVSNYHWEETETQIIQKWNYIEEIVGTDEPTIEERLKAVELTLLERMGVSL